MGEKRISKKKIGILCAVLAVVLAAAAAVVFLLTDAGKYMRAEQALNNGDYEAAQTMFEALGEYRDSKTLGKRAKEGVARKTAKKGDFISLGRFEQDGNMQNGTPEAIKWKVLAIEDGRMLVISRSALATMPYHDTQDNVRWEDSSIRKWLNEDFYNAAFSEDEKNCIVSSTLENEAGDKYDVEDCGATEDRVFLLSVEEARKYCKPSTVLLAKPTVVAEENAPLVDIRGGGNCAWWLRTVGGMEGHGAIVFYDESIDDYGVHTYYENICVRPAMWIEIGQ